MNLNKVMYKPVGTVVGILGGVAASVLFGKVWEKVTGDKEVPDPTDSKQTWTAVLLAATVQGAIFGAVKAAVDRGGAAGYRKMTGEWPGD